MRKMINDTKGAVTVFVTLLLIPAILVSGTAVDIARIHTARSIIQDANQMAANTVLTQYNALLYDLYGLMGVAENDPILAKLLDEYISVCVFGEDWNDRSIGTLQVFYGSDLSMEGPDFVPGKDLRDVEVLRRQIEDYMKFRAPAILVKELLDNLGITTLKADIEVIGGKMAIDAAIAELVEKYKELYDAIEKANLCNQAIGGIAGGSFGHVSSTLVRIRGEFIDLEACYNAWKNVDDGDEDAVGRRSELAAKYNAILSNIRSITAGGPTGSGWSDGGWTRRGSAQGLEVTIENAKAAGDSFKVKFDNVVSIAREIDGMHDELVRKIDGLERKLNSGNCDEGFKKAFTEKTGDPPKSLIERYRDVIQYDNIEYMATLFRDGGYRYIDDEYKPLLDGVKYRNSANPGASSLSRGQLASLASNGAFALSLGNRAAYFAAFSAESVKYKMPSPFKQFKDYFANNSPFYAYLTNLVEQGDAEPVALYDGQAPESGGSGDAKQRGMIRSLLNTVETAYEGIVNKPLGANHALNLGTPQPEKLGILDILMLIPHAVSQPVTDVITDPIGSIEKAADYLLLLTYDVSMFSNYTTTKPQSVGMTRDELRESEIVYPKTITGIPISPEVNYFFQSEWEYLYEGSLSAGKNLSAVTKLIYLIRLVCNYITVFSVFEVTVVVSSIQASFIMFPPLGIFLGELARAAFVAAESLVDVIDLRNGNKVPLVKNAAAGEWVCRPSSVITAIARLSSSEMGDAFGKNRGLTYSNYMLLLFISKGTVYIGTEDSAATELAKRTGNLIEWNMVNYQNNIYCDERAMSEAMRADNRFKLSDMKTDFSITTTAEMRMLFLSMPLAINYAADRGLAVPTLMPISMTDHRGY
jgi:hypothetical protein